MLSRQGIARRSLAEHVAIADRLRADPRTVLGYARSNIDRWAASFTSDRAPSWLVDWRRLLEGPLDDLLDLLTADTATGRLMRTRSPFVGFLTFRDRLDILRRVDHQMADTLELFMLTYGPRDETSEAHARQ